MASLLKQWFRELPEPVLTYKVYDKYVNTDDEVDYEVREKEEGGGGRGAKRKN